MQGGSTNLKGKRYQSLLSHSSFSSRFCWSLVHLTRSELCLVAQLCPTLCDPMDARLLHGILQARILEWVAVPSSRDRTQVSLIASEFFTEPPRKPNLEWGGGTKRKSHSTLLSCGSNDSLILLFPCILLIWPESRGWKF